MPTPAQERDGLYTVKRKNLRTDYLVWNFFRHEYRFMPIPKLPQLPGWLGGSNKGVSPKFTTDKIGDPKAKALFDKLSEGRDLGVDASTKKLEMLGRLAANGNELTVDSARLGLRPIQVQALWGQFGKSDDDETRVRSLAPLATNVADGWLHPHSEGFEKTLRPTLFKALTAKEFADLPFEFYDGKKALEKFREMTRRSGNENGWNQLDAVAAQLKDARLIRIGPMKNE